MSSVAAQPCELQNIQKIVAHGYDFHCARQFLLTVRDAGLARQFVLKLVESGWVTDAAQSRTQVAQKLAARQPPLSLGFTYQGLQALGLSDRYRTVLMHRAKAFYQGAVVRAAECLGDTGASDPRYWESAFGLHAAHVILCLHADTAQALDAAQNTLQSLAGTAFVQGGDWRSVAQEGAHLEATDAARSARRVHFDLRDGISNPRFSGLISGLNQMESEPAHALGELVLGYDNDYGGNDWRLPFELPAEVSGRRLGEPPEQSELAGFFKNASFGVIRKMAQDEPLFRRFIADWVSRHANVGQEQAMTAWLRAKLLGRWEDGTVIRPGQDHSSASTRGLNEFDFSDDPQGLGCPFGAHIRRMNPRADPVVPSRHRPLLRRSIPYGRKYRADEADGKGTEGVNRGLLGVFFCADIEDQFEHLLREWADMNPMGPPSHSQSKDPLIGNHADAQAAFDIPSPGEGQTRVTGLQAFVNTLGTAYALFPGIQALRMLEDAHVFDPAQAIQATQATRAS